MEPAKPEPIKPPEARKTDDWDRIYREGLPPWETGEPAEQLIEMLGKYKDRIPGKRAFELGSGTGADAVYLSKVGFDVTAVEFSPIAMERARARAQLKNAAVHFVLDDVFRYADRAGKFDLVYDAGFYDFARRKNLGRFLDILWRLTEPESFYFTLAGTTDEPTEDGQPSVTEREIRLELGRLFEMVELTPCRLASPQCPQGYPGWSCLMRRPRPVSG